MAKPDKLQLDDQEWQKRLSREEYQVLRRQGTEPAFCGGYAKSASHGAGTYRCSGCDLDLFSSQTKFESGTGWPSFFQPVPDHVEEEADHSHGTTRTEVHCARCNGHLGHVFNDGPRPSVMRYCINAISLRFVPTGTATAG
jgi:peptide-methionine (R)-S-oxide reductase